MTMRLRCRTCGWSAIYRHKHITIARALSAAARHDCPGSPKVGTVPTWWARLRGAKPTSVPTAPNTTNTATQFTTKHGNRVPWAVLAAYHAETTRRARVAMADLVRAGYQLGPPPYGYRALRVRVTTPNGHSKLRAVLTPDWATAAVVAQIFTWRADDNLDFTEIARRLNTDHRQYPPPTPHGRWTPSGLKRLVSNPKYAGRQVWARTSHCHPQPVEQWITSAPMAHEPLIDDRTFHRAQPRHSAGDRAT